MNQPPVALLAIVLLAAGPVAAADATSTSSPARPGHAILGDFVEMGPMAARGRDGALVELVNLSPLTLDVVIGPGSATLAPKDRMFAGVEAGDVPVTVTSREDAAARLEGDLQIEAGTKYELRFAYLPHDEPDAAGAEPGAGLTATEDGDRGAGSARADDDSARRNPTARKRKVDIGRKRR